MVGLAHHVRSHAELANPVVDLTSTGILGALGRRVLQDDTGVIGEVRGTGGYPTSLGGQHVHGSLQCLAGGNLSAPLKPFGRGLDDRRAFGIQLLEQLRSLGARGGDACLPRGALGALGGQGLDHLRGELKVERETVRPAHPGWPWPS